jgi:fructose-6-phosphate aldolase 2
MKLLIDDANIREIRRLYDLYPIDGVTTNPSILARAGSDPVSVLREIRAFIGEDALFFVQALALDAGGMVADARRILEICGKTTVVKLPSIPEGFKAMRLLKAEDVRTCGTVVYTPMQAFLAAKAGAEFVAPYVNRIDNMGYDGVKVVKEIQEILVNNRLDCMVLAASFKNSQQVMELCACGIGSATAAPAVIDGFVKNPAIDSAVRDFLRDFEKATGRTAMTEF